MEVINYVYVFYIFCEYKKLNADWIPESAHFLNVVRVLEPVHLSCWSRLEGTSRLGVCFQADYL